MEAVRCRPSPRVGLIRRRRGRRGFGVGAAVKSVGEEGGEFDAGGWMCEWLDDKTYLCELHLHFHQFFLHLSHLFFHVTILILDFDVALHDLFSAFAHLFFNICGFARGVFSDVAAAASFPVFAAVAAGVVPEAGQYPGPESAPSLLATRITSKSFTSAIFFASRQHTVFRTSPSSTLYQPSGGQCTGRDVAIGFRRSVSRLRK